jgi:hypothetical protein
MEQFSPLEDEKEYYDRIEKDLLSKIEKEEKDTFSRRFIYSNEDCISTIHFFIRENSIIFYFYIRSSNAKDILESDLSFLRYITFKIANRFKSNLSEDFLIYSTFKFGSSHILT